MAMNQPDDRLACGRRLDAVYDDALAGALDDHERSCPHCQEAAHGLAPVRRAAGLLRAESPEPRAGFVEAVMARVRAEPRRSRDLRLPADPPLRLAIREHAASALLSIAATAVTGVRVRRCRFPDPDEPGRVLMSVSLTYGDPVTATATRIRAAVRAAGRDQLGLDLHTVDIEVDDVHDRR